MMVQPDTLNRFNRLDFKAARPTALLSVVIVNYNLGALLLDCIASVKDTAPAGGACEIIVVDNASREGDLDAVEQAHPDVVIVRQAENVGFGAANDEGFEVARGEFLVALNPDARAPAGLLDRSLAMLRADPTVGVVGAAQKVSPELYVSSAQEELSPRTFFRRILPFISAKRAVSRGPVIGGSLAQDADCAAVTGSFMVFRRSDMATVGGFDRRIFMYGEEVELCARFRRHGLRSVQLGGGYVDHDHGASTRGLSLWRDVQMQAGQLIAVRLTHGANAARAAALAMTIAHLIRLPLDLGGLALGRGEKLRSRLTRLRRSAAAIVRPPVSSGQAI